jgi:hypothetical protein
LGAFALAGVEDVAVFRIKTHPCVIVREMEKPPRYFDSNWLITIERKKPDARTTFVVVHIGSDIELQKP